MGRQPRKAADLVEDDLVEKEPCRDLADGALSYRCVTPD
jgi:hypothetical protein